MNKSILKHNFNFLLKISVVLTTLSLVACTKNSAEVAPRTFVPDLKNVESKTDWQQLKITNWLDASNNTTGPTVSACERMLEIQAKPLQKQRYSFLQDIRLKLTTGSNPKVEILGGINIAESTLAQFILGEKFEVPSRDEFLKMAKVAHDKGELGGLEWGALVAATTLEDITTWGGPLRFMYYKAINDKLEKTLPGVFGEPADMSESLKMLMLSKLDPKLDLSSKDIQKILTTKLDLTQPEKWTDFSSDIEKTIKSALKNYAFDATQSQSERLCSFILLKRTFSQLLLLKGFKQVEIQSSSPSQKLARVEKLSTDAPKFKRHIKAGSFSDNEGKAIALTTEDIATYDPATKKLLLGGKPLSLSEQMSFLRSMFLTFKATSPIESWVTDPQHYMLGDIQSLKNRAVIPEDAHALAFGLMIMQFKNLASDHIVQVSADTKALKAGESAAGIILREESALKNKLASGIHLTSVAQLARLIVQIDEQLKKISAQPASDLQKMNSFYSEAVLKNLSVLSQTLAKLKLPLVLLINKMLNLKAESLTWRAESGVAPTGETLREASKLAAIDALKDIAINTRAQALLKRVEELSSQ